MKMIAPDLVDMQAPVCLNGGRHRETGGIVFPCPEGWEASDYDRVRLSPEGRLWSWTIQRFRPKSPPYRGLDPFEPYAVGYIELPGQVIVEGRLTGVAFDAIRAGTVYRTVLIPCAEDETGEPLFTYAFEPVETRT
jgi:uncharacterized OB-fold protein